MPISPLLRIIAFLIRTIIIHDDTINITILTTPPRVSPAIMAKTNNNRINTN